MTAGIEALAVYAGRAVLDVGQLADHRGLDRGRLAGLLITRKSVAMPFEDPVTFAVNAAQNLVRDLDANTRASIEAVIVASESGVDFGKSMATYVHRFLDLPRHCRLFEIKQACYGGTAALRSAQGFVAARPGSRALVICTDTARPIPRSYAEPTQGAAALALLVGDGGDILRLDPVAGVHGYEITDGCRPTADTETGDADLSLLTYLDCIEKSFLAYSARAGGVDIASDFAYLACHTPFGGMVKGAHRTLMRKLKRMPPSEIEADFQARVEPSLRFCREVGNIYSGTVFLALAGVLAHGDFTLPRRIGLFSYGSGCCSEFFSGTADAEAQMRIRRLDLQRALAGRHLLSMPEYEQVLAAQARLPFGSRNVEVGKAGFERIFDERFAGGDLLVLDRIQDWRRDYRWT